ncbi:MAG: chromate transporter [Hydrogenophaga sp.]|nr:chromate transporter [Hydrogenophaga sp.]
MNHPSDSPPQTETSCSPPGSLKELFWGFSMLSLQGFGGVMAVTQRELIDRRRWMPREEFLEDWAVAQVLPGPNVANLGVIIGDRHFGTRGSLVCLLGLFLFPLIIVSILAMAFTTFEHLPVVQGALKGMGLVVVALILTTAVKLVTALRNHVGGALFCVVASVTTFLAIAVLRWPLVWVLLVVGGLSCAWTYHRIVRSAVSQRPAP